MGTLKWIAVLALGLLAAQLGCSGESTTQGKEQAGTKPAATQPATVLNTMQDKVSYCIGVETGRTFKRQEFDVNLDLVAKGMKDALAGEQLLVTDREILTTLNYFASEVRRKQSKNRLMTALDNKAEGEAFLAENKTKEGVVALPSGLQYKVLKAGDGKKPAEGDTVLCHYRGTLVNGKEFDSSDPAGEPATFKVADVIAGWREALKLMPVGSKWQLFVPHQLAYGQQGTGRDIGPNTTLIFEVELMGIK